ncbi:MAG: ORF6N domain-containing protein, partial [Sulfuricaulis sp.]
DFMFQLNKKEFENLKSQFVISSWGGLRRMLATHADLARKLVTLEKKYDAQFRVVFEAIRELMTPPDPKKKRPIGFAPWGDK